MPAQVGMDAALLNETLAQSFGAREPYFGGLLGATRPRAAINGLIVRRAQVVAEWGDTQWLDMAHSVAKIFLTTDVGLAVRDVSLQIVSPEWISQAHTPGVVNADDGYANWSAAPASSFTFRGNGQNVICVDRQNDSLVVAGSTTARR